MQFCLKQPQRTVSAFHLFQGHQLQPALSPHYPMTALFLLVWAHIAAVSPGQRRTQATPNQGGESIAFLKVAFMEQNSSRIAISSNTPKHPKKKLSSWIAIFNQELRTAN